MLKHPSEVYLAVALAVLSLATAVFRFVMLGLLAFPLGVIALTLGVIGVKGTRQQGMSLRQQAVGLVLLVIGVAVLLAVANSTSLLAYQEAVHLQRPSQAAPAEGAWLQLAIGWLLPPGFIALGLLCWAGWSLRRCLFWAIAVFFVCPAALLMNAILDFPVTT